MADRNVGFFLPSLEASGFTKMTLNLSKGLDERGFDTRIFVVDPEGDFRSAVPAGVEVVALDPIKPHPASCIRKLADYISKYEPIAMLSAMNHGSISAVIATQIASSQTRSVVTIHTHLPTYVERFQTPMAKLTPSLVTLFYTWADRIVAVSAGAAEGLAAKTRIPLADIKVVYNPVVDQSLVKQSQKPLDHRWLDSPNCSVVLAVGRLEEHKDFSTLIEGHSIVSEQTDCRLIIIGQGEQRDRLEEYAEERGVAELVEFRGYVDNPYAYMRKADVFVFSSFGDEGLPTVIIEALACKCPVVATDCQSGPQEILCDGEYGELVPVGEPEAIASAILKTLERKPDPDRLFTRSLDFTISQAASEYINILNC